MNNRNSLLLKVILTAVTVVGTYTLSLATSTEEKNKVSIGQNIYRGHCAACHGFNGDGKGPKAAGLTPAPTNFQDGTRMSTLTDNDLEQAILAGKPGTAMHGYGTIFHHQDVEALIAYLRSLSAS